MMKMWSKEKLKKTFAIATLTAFTATGTVFAAAPVYAADSTHITEEQQVKFSDSSWIQAQVEQEKNMVQTFQAGEYTAAKPYVVVDPYGHNPLSALVMFKTPEATKVSVKVEIPMDKSGAYDTESTFSFDFNEYATEHYLPVYALFDGQNTVTLTVTDKAGKSETHAIKLSAKVPEGFNVTANTVSMDKGNPEMVSGLNFVSYVFGATSKVVGYDFNGNFRAIFTNSGQSRIAALPNGHIAYEDNNVLHGLYYTTGFIETDMMGKVYQKYLVNGIHHEFIQLENGNWLADAELPNADTTEDYFAELDQASGKIVRDWWLKDSMGLKQFVANPYYDYNAEDWAHVNSFVQIPGQDAIIFSARQNDGLYKLNLTTNEIEWIIAEDDEDYTEAFSAKRLTPVITQSDGSVVTVDQWWENNTVQNPSGAAIDWSNPKDPYFALENVPFEYTYGQHAVSLLPNGDIFVFDNGDGRSKDASKMITAADENAAREVLKTAAPGSEAYQKALMTNYSRAVIYHYDEKAGTVEQLWQYGKERGMELYSMYICDVDYLGPNHYLINFGGPRVGADLASGAYSRIIELQNDRVINEFNVNTNCYRAQRLSPYYGVEGEYQLNKIQGVQKGELLMQRAQLSKLVLDMTIGQSGFTQNDVSNDMGSAPYRAENGQIMVPGRGVAQALGAQVIWDADAQKVTVKTAERTAEFVIGAEEATLNGQSQTLENAAVLVDGRAMLPLKNLAEALDAVVEETNDKVTLTR